jgi:hypothetical protein
MMGWITVFYSKPFCNTVLFVALYHFETFSITQLYHTVTYRFVLYCSVTYRYVPPPFNLKRVVKKPNIYLGVIREYYTLKKSILYHIMV